MSKQPGTITFVFVANHFERLERECDIIELFDLLGLEWRIDNLHSLDVQRRLIRALLRSNADNAIENHQATSVDL